MLANDPNLQPQQNLGNIFQYSNGWGHLIMSCVVIIVGCLLVFLPNVTSDLKGIGISLILTVSGAWFIPGAAKQVLYQVSQQQQPPVPVSSVSAKPPVQNVEGGN